MMKENKIQQRNMKKLSIIGCGKVAKTIAKLWKDNGLFIIQDIFNSSMSSSQDAADFLQAGLAVENIGRFRDSDLFLIGASDNNIRECCQLLAKSKIVKPGNIVFHCSGAISSEILVPLRDQGAFIASVHPVKSFADVKTAVETFKGTFCGIEGDKAAIEVLTRAFTDIGGNVFNIDSRRKVFYHSATVIVCNYLVALMEVGIQAYIKSGLERDQAKAIMEPIVRGTVENIFKFDTVQALTGPIARGDSEVVEDQFKALASWDMYVAEIYRSLGSVAVNLSKGQGRASDESLEIISNIFSKTSFKSII